MYVSFKIFGFKFSKPWLEIRILNRTRVVMVALVNRTINPRIEERNTIPKSTG